MVTLNEVAQILINTLGGLAVFLFAMKMLGNQLQNVIGSKIEMILQKMTSRPAKGMIVGAVVTFLTQSSSITVLTLIGLVNIGTLTLKQGMGILLGAEIGTTITAQLVTFELGVMYFPILILGFCLSQLNDSKKASLGKVIFSFGLLFMGMELMKHGATPIKNSPAIMSLFQQFGTNPLLGILIGALFTGITSSSSATTSLVVALGVTNSISLPAGIALIIGANIGTTFLELIAVAQLGLTSKRVAIAQALINVLGMILIYPFLGLFSHLVALSSPNLAHQIANAHTFYNIGSSILFLFFVNQIVALTKKIIPGKVIKLKTGTKYLDNNLLSIPQVAISNASKEINRMGSVTLSMFSHIDSYLVKPNQTLIDAMIKKESLVDDLYLKISAYLNLISQKELDDQTSFRLSRLNHGLTDIERTADHLKKTINYLPKDTNGISQKNRNKLRKLIKMSQVSYQKALRAYIHHQLITAKALIKDYIKINLFKEKILIQKTKDNLANKQKFEYLVHHVERAAHHGVNLAHIALYNI